MTSESPLRDEESVRSTVRDGYARIAKGAATSCCGPTSCCSGNAGEAASQLAETLGYRLEDLSAVPDGANMGLSCGNPVAIASLAPGDVVVDLGSGGGFDVFVAGRRVGPTGKAIGVDMTPEMLDLARRNIAGYRESTGLDNVEFRLGEIEHLPVSDSSADVVISNCVINLSPDKPQVWREMARILRPGGRVAVSDIALLKPLPEAVREKAEALVGCVAGAVLVEDTERFAGEAGLADVKIESHSDYIRAMESWKDELYTGVADALPPGSHLGDYVTSITVDARKPA